MTRPSPLVSAQDRYEIRKMWLAGQTVAQIVSTKQVSEGQAEKLTRDLAEGKKYTDEELRAEGLPPRTDVNNQATRTTPPWSTRDDPGGWKIVDFYDGEYANWDILHKEMHSFNVLIAFDYLRRLRAILNLVGNPSGKSILDVGCGDGIHATTLAFYGGYVVGVDISRKRLERSNRRAERHNVVSLTDFILADAEHLPLRQNTFDCVFCSEVLEHLRRPTTAAGELAKAVRDEGRVVVTAPNKLSPFELISCVRKKFRLPSFAGPRSEPPIHESYTCTGLKYLLERAGLKTVRVTTASLGWRIVFEGSRRDTGQT